MQYGSTKFRYQSLIEESCRISEATSTATTTTRRKFGVTPQAEKLPLQGRICPSAS
jgi:hypothetical protein